MLSKITHRRAITVCGLACLFVLGSCGSDGTSGPAATLPPPATVSIIAMEGKAGTLLSEVYAQALESQGVRVARRAPAADLKTAMTRLGNGEGDIIFTYTNTLYTLLQADQATPSTLVPGANLTDQINAIGEVIDEKFEALPPAEAQTGGFIACLGADTSGAVEVTSTTTAADVKPTTLSGLGRIADTIKLGATADFNGDGAFSAANFKAVYGGKFKEIVELKADEVAAKLTAKEVDCATFDVLAGNVPDGMQFLADDRGMVPHDSVVPVVLKSAVIPGTNEILNSVSQQLTTEVLISMMTAVQAGRSPEVVAGSFLQASGLSQKASD
jgi:glycine betaine/choline ABC-type transport system substrate-binding protein